MVVADLKDAAFTLFLVALSYPFYFFAVERVKRRKTFGSAIDAGSHHPVDGGPVG
jgi:hypothetical protein